MRLDKYLKVARIIKRRTIANEACDKQRVLVNGKPQRASYDVKAGDMIEIQMGQNPFKAKVLEETSMPKRRRLVHVPNNPVSSVINHKRPT